MDPVNHTNQNDKNNNYMGVYKIYFIWNYFVLTRL